MVSNGTLHLTGAANPTNSSSIQIKSGALLDLSGFAADSLLVATCDAQVEGQHFTLSVATPEEIGHKALASSRALWR